MLLPTNVPMREWCDPDECEIVHREAERIAAKVIGELLGCLGQMARKHPQALIRLLRLQDGMSYREIARMGHRNPQSVHESIAKLVAEFPLCKSLTVSARNNRRPGA